MLTRYDQRPVASDQHDLPAEALESLLTRFRIDRKTLRANVRRLLARQPRVTLTEVVAVSDGVEWGLPELIGYVSILDDFPHEILLEEEEIALGEKMVRLPGIVYIRDDGKTT